jgi:hypothetical protein
VGTGTVQERTPARCAASSLMKLCVEPESAL